MLDSIQILRSYILVCGFIVPDVNLYEVLPDFIRCHFPSRSMEGFFAEREFALQDDIKMCISAQILAFMKVNK